MLYDESLCCRYPIASGVIEDACPHSVKDRMERSGMRWALKGTPSMLHVRPHFKATIGIAFWTGTELTTSWEPTTANAHFRHNA